MTYISTATKSFQNWYEYDVLIDEKRDVKSDVYLRGGCVWKIGLYCRLKAVEGMQTAIRLNNKFLISN